MPALHPPARVLPANEHRRERWRNGLGWTRAIMAWPADAGWAWRLSVAEIEQAAPYSSFPGVEREHVLLEGNGLVLRFGDGRTKELHPPAAARGLPAGTRWPAGPWTGAGWRPNWWWR